MHKHIHTYTNATACEGQNSDRLQHIWHHQHWVSGVVWEWNAPRQAVEDSRCVHYKILWHTVAHGNTLQHTHHTSDTTRICIMSHICNVTHIYIYIYIYIYIWVTLPKSHYICGLWDSIFSNSRCVHYKILWHTVAHGNTLQRTHLTSDATHICIMSHICNVTQYSAMLDFRRVHMGWLRLVGPLKLQVSFAEYRLFYRALLQKRPIILRSLLAEATP